MVSLLVQLILDEKIAARIDGIEAIGMWVPKLSALSAEPTILAEGFLQVSSGRGEKAKQFTGLQKWVFCSVDQTPSQVIASLLLTRKVDSFERIHSSLHTKLNQMQHG